MSMVNKHISPLAVIAEIRQVVGRLIWEFEHELPTSEVGCIL